MEDTNDAKQARRKEEVVEKKEEPPKLSTTAIEEKDTRSIENAKKEAAEKVLKEMAALEAQMSRFSTGSDESIDSPKSGAESKAKISVPDVELPPGTKSHPRLRRRRRRRSEVNACCRCKVVSFYLL